MTFLTLLSVLKGLYFVSTFEGYFHQIQISRRGFLPQHLTVIISLSCFHVSVEKSAAKLLCYLSVFITLFFFPLSALKFILKIFNHTMMYLCVFFVFIYLSHLGFLAHLKSVGLKIFTSFRKISAIICLYITSVSFSFSPLARTPIMYMSNHLTVFCMSFTLCSIFSFFSVCVSI